MDSGLDLAAPGTVPFYYSHNACDNFTFTVVERKKYLLKRVFKADLKFWELNPLSRWLGS